MLGNPCDARASYCQTPGLPLAAAADWGDRLDGEAARAASDCHARHADRCPCHRTHPEPQACPVSRTALPTADSALPGLAGLVADVVDRCADFERAADPSLDEKAARSRLGASRAQLERWCAAAIRRTAQAQTQAHGAVPPQVQGVAG